MSSPALAISRYFWIVCAGYAMDLASYVAMTEMGVPLYAAYLASFAVGCICNVLLLRRFFAPGRHPLARDIGLSMASNGAVILLAMGLYAALMHLAGLHHIVAKVVSNGASFLVNYRVRRSWF